MKYHLDIARSAEHQFKKLPITLQDRIIPKLLSLEDNPRPFGTKKLRDSSFYRIRIGDYRVIYSIDDRSAIVRILDIAHRRDVYR